MKNKRCIACKQEFQPKSHAPRQTYCSASACQRARKRQWEKDKRRNDPDYLDNQNRSQRTWCIGHPDYWHNYRGGHPDYVEKNRKKQHDRNARNRGKAIAKMDASNGRNGAPDLRSGLYQINSIPESMIAKMPIWSHTRHVNISDATGDR